MKFLWNAEEPPDLSKIEHRATSVAQLLVDRIAETPATEAFRFLSDGRWASVSWKQFGERVDIIAAGLIALGIRAEDRVALISSTRYEWVLADFAVMCAGAATTTVYPTTNAPGVAFIVANSGSRVVLAEDRSQVGKLIEHRAELPDVRQVVIFDGEGDGNWVITLDELEQRGRGLLAASPGAVVDRIRGIRPEHLGSIMYTSGTTGTPKGVRLPHSAWTYSAAAIDAVNVLRPDDLNFLWLPLSHAFGKVMLALAPLIGFPTAIDGRVDKIVENLAVLHPTIVAAAPRIFEKAHARIESAMAEEGGIKKKVFDWAVGVGLEVSRARQAGKDPSLPVLWRYRVADKLVLSKIRARFGGRLRYFVSAAAPLDRDVAQWFDAIGLVVLEGYGLTETAAASFINRPGAYRFGTVGKPFPGTEAEIAEDGEILLRSPGVMSGYHDRPEATAEALDADGWFHTGDIGEIDADGFLHITDRKKDLFKTSQGKYVAPSAIAATFKGICPYAAEFIVYGETRPYCVALVGLDAQSITEWAGKHGLAGKPLPDIARDERTHEVIAGYVDRLNTQLDRWEQIKRFDIIDHELSVEAGDLTPSMKLRRKIVVENLADSIDALYR
ncbi:long-chain fatty acid--CoA ligase [Nocardia implantans]|uniref:Acyl-CoA synthetase n=1 Tax=Nocardia implantans TaxID=3108168 RepID=A0ABU6AX97_9NOCA|nr:MULTISPECIES: long-chain fatty acid--CoA ligase [unclassified Nocardia]MBF6193920.1 long-chain fatty acid--CoA ligase [Nocardia beijingensis]MEA3529341.1 long-chain fatty acid--CoA ligase [Nocardia sp. CDC192]MEB3511927.1 long-chain fatty acid--CoA ligase [Nocardia sp. CDC186]